MSDARHVGGWVAGVVDLGNIAEWRPTLAFRAKNRRARGGTRLSNSVN